MKLNVKAGLSVEPRSILETLTRLINELLAKGEKVPSESVVSGYSGPDVGSSFRLTHALLAKPVGIKEGSHGVRGVTVWATADDRLAWTDTEIVVRCNAANTPIEIIVYTMA